MTMSYKKMGAGSEAGSYYINSAGLKSTVRGVDDYYQQSVGSEPVGTFTDFSGALEQFGIKHGDEVTVESFQRLLNGRDPLNNNPLTDTVYKEHVSGFDCTNNAPKPFSALRALAKSFGNDDLDKILDKIGADSNQKSMEFLSEKASFTRTKKGGTIHERVALISAEWEHGTSREADPHKHYHNTIFNVAFRKDGSSGSIESKYLMQWATAAGAVFRAELAIGLKKEFPDVNIIIDEKKGTFEIEGINEDLITFWSKRRNEIKDAMRESGSTSYAAADKAVLETRKNKTFEESPEELDVRWKVEAESFGVTAQSIQDVLTTKNNLIYDMAPVEKAALDKQEFEAKMNAIPSMLIENESVFTEQSLYRKVAELSAGIQDLNGIQDTVNRLMTRSAAEISVKDQLLQSKEMKNGRRESRINGTERGIRHDELGQLGSTGISNGSGARPGFTNGKTNYEPNLDAVDAVRATGLKNSLRTLSESRLARHGAKATGQSLLRADALSHRRTAENLRRNVLNQPLKTVREEVLKEQRDPNSVIVEMGHAKLGQKIFTTLAQIQIEYDLKKRSREMAEDKTHGIDKKIIAGAISKKGTMSIEQADAVRWALSPGSLKIVEGGAGTGKSFSLDVVRQVAEECGYKIHGIALSWQAASVLQSSASIESVAITGFLNDVENGRIKLNEKSLLVCDENGLVGTVYGQKLLEVVQKFGAKIIITGDSQQLNPVSAGSAMKIMLGEAGSAKITEIRRQKDPVDREMVANFAVGNSTEALDSLSIRGKITNLFDKKSTIDRVANDFYNYLKNNTGKSALALCGSNEEAFALNKVIRELKRADGLIGKVDTIIRTEYGDLAFAIGDKIMFRKNDKQLDITNRKTGEILDINTYKDGHQIKVRMEDGSVVNIDSRKYKGEKGFLNIHHGDAMTIYSSQGATVDQTFVMHSNRMDRREAYVAFSRHKDQTNLYIDVESVISQMQSELVGDKKAGFKPTDKEILDYIKDQYHNQNQKLTTFDYLTDAQVEKIIAENAVTPTPEFKYDTSAIDEMSQSINDAIQNGWDDVSETNVFKVNPNFKKLDSPRLIIEKEEEEVEIVDEEINIRRTARLK